jgi:hypothetical protein
VIVRLVFAMAILRIFHRYGKAVNSLNGRTSSALALSAAAVIQSCTLRSSYVAHLACAAVDKRQSSICPFCSIPIDIIKSNE